jgi:hypothetical protein
MRTVLLTLICCSLSASVSVATTWLVDQSGGGDFTCIQEAIDYASSGDEIIVNPGIYEECLNYSGKDLHAHSAAGPDSTTIDATYVGGSCVTFAGGETEAAILEGFTVTHGDGTDAEGLGTRVGGGIYCYQSWPTIRNCWFIDNIANNGAAIYMREGNPEVANCVFRDNLAEGYGSGISVVDATPFIHHCLFEDNTALTGDGTIHLTETAVIEDCIFRNNTARQGAGVNIGHESASSKIVRCIFEGNRATGVHGGAVRSHEASPVITYCLFVDNWAAADGGAIVALDGGTPLIAQCTFYRNGADRYGGNIAVWNGSAPRIINTIIADALNAEGVFAYCADPVFECCDAWNNAGGNYVGVDDPTGINGNISADPMFCNPANSDFTLHRLSPCAAENHPECGLIGAYPVACGGYVVNPDGTGDLPTIQAAVDACVDGDVIDLTDGVFAGAENRDIDFRGKAIIVRSQCGDPAACIIDCEGSAEDPHRGFCFHSGETSQSVVQGVTITGGYAPGPSHCGGAVYCDGSSPSFVECVLTSNAAERGGGMGCGDLSSPTLAYCSLALNAADYGGALSCNFSMVTLDHCTLYGNIANGLLPAGAGIECGSYASLELENTIIAFSERGQAVRCDGSAEATLTCCDVYGNADGDWVGCIADQHGGNGNFSADPCFCDPENGDYQLWNFSPCMQEACGQIGAWPIGCAEPQAGDENITLPPSCGLSIGASVPNPFRSGARITYAIPELLPGSPVTLSIHDATGRCIRSLICGWQPPGRYIVPWDGSDSCGRPAPGGAYFCRLACGREDIVRQFVLIR